MDFDDSPEEAAFRTRAKLWLNAHAESIWSGGHGSDEDLRLRAAKSWQALKADAGFAGLSWPTEMGGQGLPPIFEVIWAQEEQRFQLPTGVFEIGLGMCLPAVTHYAPAEIAAPLALAALRGDEIWCQLFSEPSAGSDVAAIRTRAVRDGADWVVNGQKVWTSGAHFSDFGLLIARTDTSVPKHRGMTMFFIDMRTPGIEVAPLRQATDDYEFNEVFFTDVRVPDANRLGRVGEGWSAVLTTLMFERLAVADGYPFPDVAEALTLANGVDFLSAPAITDGRVRERIADWWINSQGLRLLNFRAVTELSHGRTPGPEFSIAKLVAARQVQQVASFMMDMLGPQGMLNTHSPDVPNDITRAWLWGAAARIAGGSDEILLNVIGERVLGLPPEPRVDKTDPFDQLSI